MYIFNSYQWIDHFNPWWFIYPIFRCGGACIVWSLRIQRTWKGGRSADWLASRDFEVWVRSADWKSRRKWRDVSNHSQIGKSREKGHGRFMKHDGPNLIKFRHPNCYETSWKPSSCFLFISIQPSFVWPNNLLWLNSAMHDYFENLLRFSAAMSRDGLFGHVYCYYLLVFKHL